MVKKMIEAARKTLAAEVAAQALEGFRQGLGLPLDDDLKTPPES